MIDPVNVLKTPFAESHLLTKLQRVIIVARIVGEDASQPTTIHKVIALELKGDLYEDVKRDYLEVQSVVKDRVAVNGLGFRLLSGKMGKYVQPRTKGSKDSSTRAFYARREFLSRVLGIDYLVDSKKKL